MVDFGLIDVDVWSANAGAGGVNVAWNRIAGGDE